MREPYPPNDAPGSAGREVSPPAPGLGRGPGEPGRPGWVDDGTPRHRIRSDGSGAPGLRYRAKGDGVDGADDDGDDHRWWRRSRPAKPPRSLRRTILEWAGVIGGGIVIALVIEAFFIQAFWIPTPSMVGTLNVDDRVLVNKLSYRLHDVHRGDIIVFSRPPGASSSDGDDDIKDLIKRVVAVGGDTIEARDGLVYVNDERVDESGYLAPGTPTDNLPRQTVPEGHVFVMGDNRTNSEDSRVFGPVDEDSIVGRAFLRVLPIGDIGFL